MNSQITGSRLSTDKPVFNRSSRYGEWIKRPIDLSLNPMPKREAEIVRAPTQEWGVLTLRRMDPKTLSAPYARATGVKTPDAIMLKMAELEASEQPDGGDLIERDLIDDYYDDDYSGIP